MAGQRKSGGFCEVTSPSEGPNGMFSPDSDAAGHGDAAIAVRGPAKPMKPANSKIMTKANPNASRLLDFQLLMNHQLL
jgi:hypothetical protein